MAFAQKHPTGVGAGGGGSSLSDDGRAFGPSTRTGTFSYMAPEVFRTDEYDEKVKVSTAVVVGITGLTRKNVSQHGRMIS